MSKYVRSTVSVILILLLFMNITVLRVLAKETDTDVTQEKIQQNGVHTEGIIDDGEAQAEMLKTLGIFKGTSKGLELDRGMKRTEAAVMLVRLMGAEEKVLSGKWNHPYKDVPSWANPYVGWLYQSRLIKGISTNEFGSNINITFDQYATILSRVEVDVDNWESYVATKQEASNFADGTYNFTRYTAVTLTTRLLGLTYLRNGNWTYSMAQFFIDKGLFTKETLYKASKGVITPQYKYIQDKIGLFVCNTLILSSKEGNVKDILTNDNAKDNLYAMVKEDEQDVMYRVNKADLSMQRLMTFDTSDNLSWNYEWVLHVGDADYFLVTNRKSKETQLMSFQNDEAQIMLPNVEFYYRNSYSNEGEYEKEELPQQSFNYFVADDSFVIESLNGYYYINDNEAKYFPFDQGSQIIGYDGKSMVLDSYKDGIISIQCYDATTGEMTDSYPLSNQKEALLKEHLLSYHIENMYYGFAGLYVLENSRLSQFTNRCTEDVFPLDNVHAYFLLCHEPETSMYQCDQLVYLNNKGDETLLLNHGLFITGFLEGTTASEILCNYQIGVGMGHYDEYQYKVIPSVDENGLFNSGMPKVEVIDFIAARPEVEEKGYREKVINEEQKKLAEAGF